MLFRLVVMKLRVPVLLTFLLVACGGEAVLLHDTGPTETDPPPPPVTETLRTKLDDGLTLGLTAASGEITASHSMGGHARGRAALDIEDGHLALRTTPNGAVFVDALAISVGDLEIGAEVLPPDGMVLTELELLLTKTTLDTQWIDDEVAVATVRTPVRLGWAIFEDGDVVSLAEATLDDLELRFEIVDNGDGVGVDMSMIGSGVVWAWGGLAQLEDPVVRSGWR